MIYCGIADAHGIESFVPEEEARKGLLQMRAETNRQRHACYYEIDLEENDVSMVRDQIKKKDFKKALEVIKGVDTTLKLTAGHEKSWNMIPNDDLDPYY